MALENEIILKNQEGQILASSLEIAEHFEKRHDHTLRDIEKFQKDIPNFGEMFIQTFNEDSYGRPRKEYLLTRDGFSLLVMGFTGAKALEWKLKYIEAFNKMESMLKNPTHSYMIQDPIERAKAWIKEQEEKQALEHQVKELEPARIFTQAVTGTDDGILIRELAIILNQNGVDIGEKRLYKWLRENGYVIKREGADKNLPTQKAMDLGVLTIRESVRQIPGHEPKLQKTTRVTGKGQTYFINKFLN